MSSPSIINVTAVIGEWEKNTHLSEEDDRLLELLQLSSVDAIEKLDDQSNSLSEQHIEINYLDGRGDFLDDDAHEMDSFYNSYLTKLTHYQELSHSLIVKSNNTLALSDDLQQQYELVCSKTSKLHHDCETLVKDTEHLEKLSFELESRLKHFDDMDQLNQQLTSSGSLDVVSDSFIKTLGKLDESINFLSSNIEYKESKTYLTKHKYLLSRALAHVRDFIILKIRSTTEVIYSKLKSTESTDDMQETLLYIDFRVSVDSLRPLIRELDIRSGRRESAVFLTDCLDAYLQQRRTLLFLAVPARISQHARNTRKDGFLRSGCEYILQICTQETQLFQFLFSECKDERKVMSRFASLMTSVTNILYDTVREMVVKESRIDILCSLIEVLQNDILHDSIKTKAKSTTYFEPVVHMMVQDIQERLIYRSSYFIANEIAKYLPIPEDLDYPNKMKDSQETTNPKKPDPFEKFYPTLAWTLLLLKKLYKVLDVEVFEGLAQEAVSVCAQTFIDASKKISDKSDAFNGSLFLISHLLTLLQELSYFKVSFTKTETTLDFSHLYEGISRFLKGQASFSASIIFDLLSQTRPRLVVNNIDSKKDLEKQLKIACENFILNTVKHVADSCLTFIKKHNINKDILQQESNDVITKEISTIKREFSEELKPKLDYIRELLPIYLHEDKTRLKLTQPIAEQLISLYEQLSTYIRETNDLQAGQKDDLLKDMLTVDQLKEQLHFC